MVRGDICDAQLLEMIFSKYEFDMVVHFAAESHVDRSIDNAMVFIETNIIGTLNLLETSKIIFLKGKKILNFCIYQQMRYMVHLKTPVDFLNQLHMIQVRHILHLKQVLTIWLERGLRHMDYQR